MVRMVRRLVALGLLGGLLACAQPATAQGIWFGGIGFGSPGFYGPGFAPYGYGFGNPGFSGGFAPYRAYRYGYPVAARPVYAGRPVVYGGSPSYVSRPVTGVPVHRAYRRAYRRCR